MRIRGFVSLAIATIVISACAPVAGGEKPAGTDGAGPATKWTPSRTPDGQPDIQGIWTNYTNTPFEVFDEKDQPGLYKLVYQICEIASPTTCSQATASIDLSGK